MALQTISKNDTNSSQIVVFFNQSNQIVDISAATISGLYYTREGISSGSATPITGLLVPEIGGGAAQGRFEWQHSPADVSVAGQFLVQFQATFATPDPDTTEHSQPANWIIEDTIPGKGFDFSYDLSTQIGQLRLHLGDTNLGSGPYPGNFNFLDEEMNYFLTLSAKRLTGALVSALMTLSNVWTPLATSEWIGNPSIKVDTKQVADNFEKRATWFRKNPLEDVARNKFGVLHLFRKDAHSNPPHEVPGDLSGDEFAEEIELTTT